MSSTHYRLVIAGELGPRYAATESRPWLQVSQTTSGGMTQKRFPRVTLSTCSSRTKVNA
jgi:hypothetical protein